MRQTVEILSLGFGKQSVYYLLKMLREGKAPNAAIFCDLGSEPKAVYEYIEWFQQYALEKYNFSPHIVKTQNLYQEILSYIKGDISRVSNIPMFTKKGLLFRQCTMDYKISVVRRSVKRLFPDVKHCNMHLGISFDERERITKSDVKWVKNTYNLVDQQIRLFDIINWFKEQSLPIPPKSSCLFCPFHSDGYWLHLKTTSPEDFEAACLLDDAIRDYPKMKEKCYLHRSCKPLREIDFETLVNSQLKAFPEQIEECYGYCGS